MADVGGAELLVFSCKESYVYQVPPATTVGHRADTWNVNKWLTEVAVRVVTIGDDCFIRLEDCKTGELFAECPVPKDAPIVTVVEPVIDSSRYFVLRIVDRDTGRHAFIGLGFRERSEASNFNAALYEHQQYLKRKRVAEARRKEFEEREQRASEGAEAPEDAAMPAVDYAIKPGEKITLKLTVAKQEKTEGFLSKGSKLSSRFNLFGAGGSASSGVGSVEGSSPVPTLAPPPGPRRTSLSGPDPSTMPTLTGTAAIAAAEMCVSPRDSSAGEEGQAILGSTGATADGTATGSSASGGETIRGCADDAQSTQDAETPGDSKEGAHQSGMQASGASTGLDAAVEQQLDKLQLEQHNGGQQQGDAVELPGVAAAEAEEDDWGDFTSS